MNADTCLVRNCTRTRRWGNADNAKRYCRECGAYVMREGSEPLLDTRGMMVSGQGLPVGTASGPNGLKGCA